MVVAVRTPVQGGRKGEVQDVLDGQHGSASRLFEALPGDECCAEGAHYSCNIRADGLDTGNLLESPEYCIIIEGAALDDDVFSQVPGIGQLDDLEKGVFDDRIGQAGGDVRDRSPLLLGLLDLRIHEDRAAGAQVNRVLCEEGFFGEVFDRIIQGLGEGLDEGAAAGGAGLVQLDRVDGAVLDLDALHVLAADIEDAVNLGVEESSRIVVGDGLDFSVVQLEGGFQEGLPVAGGAGVDNVRIGRELFLDLLHGPDGGQKGRALIIIVERIYEFAVFVHEGQLGRGGSGINPKEEIPAGFFEFPGLYMGPGVALGEGVVLGLVLEEGLHAGYLKLDLEVAGQALLEFGHGEGRILVVV